MHFKETARSQRDSTPERIAPVAGPQRIQEQETRMIIVRLSGGLGNQLFQYATGRAIAIRNNQRLLVDHRVFQTDGFRQFCLPAFNASYDLASDLPEYRALIPPTRKQWLRFLMWRLTSGRQVTFVREKSLLFDPHIRQLSANVYLHGYWQSEQYFDDVRSVLRDELSVRVPPSEENLKWLSEIESCESVSLHVRRGDYVADPKASRVHGLCSLDYYRLAVKYMADRLTVTPSFYVFSDDPEWVRENLKLPYAVRYVTHNDDAHNYEDLRLMSMCSHHIVANSSFSWWGAWLGRNPNRIVIAPKTWFKDPSRSDQSLVPATWVRL
jgi:hypothetical protein